MEIESSSAESSVPGGRSGAGKISKVGGTGKAVAAMATSGKKTSLQPLLATTGKKASLQELLATTGNKTSKQELLATTGKTSKQESVKTARSEVRKAALLLSQLASLRGRAGDVSLRESRERLISQSMEALSNAEILASREEEEAGRKIAQEASIGPNAYQACAQSDDDWSDKEEQHEVMEFLKQNMADDYDESAKFEATAPEEATEDGIRVMRISEEAAEVAAEEEMMMMGLGGLAEEAAEELTKSGEQNKRRRRGNRSTHELMVAAREKQGKLPQEAYTDPNAHEARNHRIGWDWIFAPLYGPFDQITSIPPSCFTHHRFHNPYARPQETLQIFSIKVGKINKPLKWPLHVFGSVAVRDVVDHNRIMVFHRERENCQTLIKKDRFLTLTGPTRGVVVDVHPTYIEVDLKVKGATELEDMDLSYLVVSSMPSSPSYRAVPSKLSTLELTYVRMYHCVEAAISVKVKKHGLWPGCRGLFTASTASYEDMEILLLAFEGDRLPVDASRRIELSRSVVSVELPQLEGKLVFSAKALHGSDEKNVRRVRKTFTPKRAGKSKENIKIGSCEMEVTVTWSLLPSYKFDYDKSLERA